VAALLFASCGAAAAPSGAEVYRAHCARCHGEHGDGRSRLAEVLQPKPADLQRSTLTRAQQERIVRFGGEASGRSPLMPNWQGTLSEPELAGVLDHLGALRAPARSAQERP
jgi:mono/diheme cytochrome c family protein